VLFSPAGVTADDVIKELVRAEPGGRVLVVVSSDRQVADTVARDGARTAGSAVLLGLIGA
jgi:predicted RNA-binding protein with PIN domain